MPFDNCPEHERAPDRAGTGNFWESEQYGKGLRPLRNRKTRAPPVPAEARGLAGLAYLGATGAGDRMPFGNCRYMNGHRNVYVPEILGEGAVPEWAHILRNLTEGTSIME
jgi:hypothetical protein